jgi:hypothetical protein
MFYFKKDIDEMQACIDHQRSKCQVAESESRLRKSQLEMAIRCASERHLEDVDLTFTVMPSGARFQFYDSQKGRDIIAGEGGSILLEISEWEKHLDDSELIYKYRATGKRSYYYLCKRDKSEYVFLMRAEDIRIIQPKLA